MVNKKHNQIKAEKLFASVYFFLLDAFVQLGQN